MTFRQKIMAAALAILAVLGFSLLGIVVFGDAETVQRVKDLPFMDILKMLGGLLVFV